MKNYKLLNEKITLPIEVGSIVLFGKFLNKKGIVKGFSKDKNNQPLVQLEGGKEIPLLKLRIASLLPVKEKLERGSWKVFKEPYFKKIEKFILENFESIFPLFVKLRKYSLGEEGGYKLSEIKFTKEEIELFNSIPVDKDNNVNINLPLVIYRGLEIGEDKVKKFIKKNKKLIYNPKNKSYSSWSTNLEEAKKFALNQDSSSFLYNLEVIDIILKSKLTSKNKFIDVSFFQRIFESINGYYSNSKQKLLPNQNKLFKMSKFKKYPEEEILVFGKLKIDKIITDETFKDELKLISESYKRLFQENYDYHCLLLPINDDYAKSNIKLLQRKIKKEDVYNDETNNFGLELNPHVTILYGLKSESDYEPLKQYFKNKPEVKISIGEISLFENDDKPYDVLKFNIISPDLVKYNSYIKENFDCDVTFPNYKPHLTIGYVNKGQGKKYLNLDSDLVDEVFRESDLQFNLANGEKLKIELGG